MIRPPALQAMLAATVLLVATIVVVLLRRPESTSQAGEAWRTAMEERLRRAENLLAAQGARTLSPVPSRDRLATAGPAPSLAETTTAESDTEPEVMAEDELTTLRAQVDALALRIEGLEQDPIQRGYAFVSSDSDELRREGIRMLRRIARFDPQARAAIRDLLRDPSARVRAEALEVLGGELHDKESLPAILAALDDSENNVRRRAIQALGSLGDAAAGAAVAQQLEDSDERVREEAADVLGRLKTREAGAGLMKALRDPSESVRGQAIASLGEIDHKEAAATLRGIYDTDPGPHRMRLILSLRQLGDEQPFRQEIARLSRAATQDADERGRARALDLLANMARRESQTLFEQALQDPNASVREAAQRALRRRE